MANVFMYSSEIKNDLHTNKQVLKVKNYILSKANFGIQRIDYMK